MVELGQDAGAGAGAGAGPQGDVDGIDEDAGSLMRENESLQESMQDFLRRSPIQEYGQKVMNVDGLGPIEVRNAMRMMRDDASYVGQSEGGGGGVVEGVALAELVSGAPAIADANLNGRVGYSVR